MTRREGRDATILMIEQSVGTSIMSERFTETVAFIVVDGPHVPADVTGIEMMREQSR
jgi:hypothetical protein